MQIDLTSEQRACIQRSSLSGRLDSEEDAAREALALWEERERERADFLLSLEEARRTIARGEGREITEESVRQLAAEVKDRGRARLTAEWAASR